MSEKSAHFIFLNRSVRVVNATKQQTQADIKMSDKRIDYSFIHPMKKENNEERKKTRRREL